MAISRLEEKDNGGNVAKGSCMSVGPRRLKSPLYSSYERALYTYTLVLYL